MGLVAIAQQSIPTKPRVTDKCAKQPIFRAFSQVNPSVFNNKKPCIRYGVYGCTCTGKHRDGAVYRSWGNGHRVGVGGFQGRLHKPRCTQVRLLLPILFTTAARYHDELTPLLPFLPTSPVRIIMVVVVTLIIETWLLWLCCWMHQWHPLIYPEWHTEKE